MEAAILNGVGKKMRNGYLKGEISENKIVETYAKNKKEADSFSMFGYKIDEIYSFMKETHNPLLKEKLQRCLEEKRDINKRCSVQNELNIAKLNRFKEDACGMGLRKVLRYIKKLAKTTKKPEIKLIQLLLETEFANLSAKQHKKQIKGLIYERKNRLLYQMADYLEKVNWKYGINDEAGKNACYLVYVYLPNDVQLTWHCNEYGIYNCYPIIEAEWDGQVCMTMEKILSYIEEMYFEPQVAA